MITRARTAALGTLAAVALFAGCSAVDPATAPTPRAENAARGAATQRPAAASTPSASTPDPKATPAWPTPAASADTRTGAQLDQPFTVDGVVVVSKEHPVSARYASPWAGQPEGINPDSYAAFGRMASDARAAGLTLTIRSGYRDYATQAASFNRALQTYDEATARRYFAEPGKSEHQTGLAFDVWDGVNRGAAFARTDEADWVAANAYRYGFIVRYPDGKTDITGYAWESWHLRWVGTDIAADFGPNSSLTLEEYLGLA
ncbi:D-alanyl-D-alanine carboxypeptidase family protein [Propioniciclava sp.]|uniref:D-alanyl-D-alanine carboxypeptidase family protein n=1 Tax=Propioniciclava sp. TaxID=2038686 RepID=UPI00261C8885|nr:D-alanyl-D-alanine carboxypeptidase family protein [Propioniciclava sp.]